MSTRLEQLAALSKDELLARVQELEAGRIRKAGFSPRVGEKGGVSLYGFGRFPVTQYAETWVKMLAVSTGLAIADLKTSPMGQFIIANADALKFKNGIPEFGIGPNEAAAE